MIANDPLEVLAHQIANETGLDMSKAFQVANILSVKIHNIMFDNEALKETLETIADNGYTGPACAIVARDTLSNLKGV